MANKPLDPDAIQALLTSQPQAKGPITEPRTTETFYRLNHLLYANGCSNPDCQDPRPHDDEGRKVVVSIATLSGDKYICRHCFLEGYLSNNNG